MINKILLIVCLLSISLFSEATNWKAEWISAFEQKDSTNTWTVYHKSFQVTESPSVAMAKIACDSKYWMWINGELAVFEGQLKRGPTQKDTYYDEMDIAPFLKQRDNTLAILVWFFGKDGFSHNNSGKSGFIFECQASNFELLSNMSWSATVHPAFEQAGEPIPNFRLPESNIRYDARKGNLDFIKEDFNSNSSNWQKVVVMGTPPVAPWNNLILRPIPFWKDFGLNTYENDLSFPFVSNGDTIIGRLPYNAQVTPFFKIEADGGEEITILTDYYEGGGAFNVRGEYIARRGIQEYENFGWMNGQNVYYVIPKGVKVLDLR